MTTIENELLPRMRFPARDRSGIFLGLSGPQLTLGGGAILAVAGTAATGAPLLVTGLVALGAAPLVTLALLTWRGESQLLRLGRLFSFGSRKASGQTTYRRNVWRRTPGADRPAGDGPRKPEVIDTVPLPGALGDVKIVQVPGGGAFVHNAKAGLVAVTVTIRSTAWQLRNKSDQVSAYEGIVDWFSGLDTMTGLTDAACRIRVDRAATTELEDYVAARDAERLFTGLATVTPELERDYQELMTLGAQRAMSFTNTITLTFRVAELAKHIRAAGKGMTGLGVILADRIEQLRTACDGARVEFDTWLNADEILSAIAMGMDPTGTSARRERSGPTEAALPVMGIDESFHQLRVDASTHQTYWIAEWPRMESRVGFLEPLLYTGECSRVLTLQLRPVPLEKALTRVNQKQSSKEFAETVNLKLQKRTTRREEREQEDLDDRENDLVDGYSDIQLRGFVTISADSAEALARGQAEIEQAQHKARVKLASMWGQQAAAFTTAVLPVPTGTK